MNDRLLELAKEWGVEIAPDSLIVEHYGLDFRPRLDIAHDLLAKLQGDIGIQWDGDNKWRAYWEEDEITADFESAVIALAERAKP